MRLRKKSYAYFFWKNRVRLWLLSRALSLFIITRLYSSDTSSTNGVWALNKFFLYGQICLGNSSVNRTLSEIVRRKIFFTTIVKYFSAVFGFKENMRTFPDVIVCAFDFLEFVRGAGDAFQPATVTLQMDGLTVAIGATGFLALSDWTDYEVTNFAAQTLSIGTMTID